MSNGLLPDAPSKLAPHAPRRGVRVLFALVALGFGAAALFHAAALVLPAIAEPSPSWRHALFVAINLAVAAGFLFRPRWFAFAFAALTVQQIYSHGTQGWQVWHLEHRVDWASLVVLLALPPLAWLLLRHRRRPAGY